MTLFITTGNVFNKVHLTTVVTILNQTYRCGTAKDDMSEQTKQMKNKVDNTVSQSKQSKQSKQAH